MNRKYFENIGELMIQFKPLKRILCLTDHFKLYFRLN